MKNFVISALNSTNNYVKYTLISTKDYARSTLDSTQNYEKSKPTNAKFFKMDGECVEFM